MASKQGSATISQFLGQRTDTPPEKCPENYSPDCADMVFSVGGMSTRPPFLKTLTMPEAINWDEEFTGRDGTIYRVALGVSGNLYSIAPDGTYTVVDTVAPGSSAISVVAYGRIYISFFNDSGGCDAPRQWDGKNLRRVSQGAPGAPPVLSAQALSTDSYPITSITQPTAMSRTSSYFLQAAAVGSPAPGTLGVAYYSDSTLGGPDADLVNAFTSGFPVYVYFSFTGVPTPIGPLTAQVTGIGLSSPPGQPRQFYYFTFQMPTSAYIFYAGSGHPGYTANYQRTLATMTTGAPVPGLGVGSVADVVGTSAAGYNSPWTITQDFNSGELTITQTSLIGGVGTYDYLISTGVAPVAGQQVTVQNTLNANGALNSPVASDGTLTPFTIASVAGGSFTVNGLPTGTDYALIPDSGTAVTAGTIFAFDPGTTTVGSTNSPIFGNATGGSITFSSTANTIASGKRIGVVMFWLDDGTITAPSDPFTFTVPVNTGKIAFTNLPIGPPNVKARVLAFTGANGSKFFMLLVPPQVNGITSGTSTVINDNITTAGTVFFGDPSLLQGEGIDIPGYNLFANTALNLPRGVNWYEDRLFWIGEKNTVFGFKNMDFAGGAYAPSNEPNAWAALTAGGSVAQVGFMPAMVITGPGTGLHTQPAYATSIGNPLLSPLLNYSIRLWFAGTSSRVGELIFTISSASTGFSSVATFALATITADGYLTALFSGAMPATIPADMLIQYEASSLPADSSVIFRDMQLIYADNPNRNPLARAAYVQEPGNYDIGTCNIGPNDDPTELRAIFLLQENLHFLTEKRLYAVNNIANSEPSSWQPYQVADKCGAFNANAVATGRGWAAWAGSYGAFWFSGSSPEKTSTINAPIWKQIANVLTIFDDPTAERVYFSTVDTQGAQRMQVYDYHEVGIGGSGKWSPWNRPVRWVSDSVQGTRFTIGASSYSLSANPGTDDDNLGSIGGYYTFAAVGGSMFKKTTMTGTFMGLTIAGSGVMTPFLYAKALSTLTEALKGQDLAALLDVVAEWPANQNFRRLFMKLGQPGVQFTLSGATMLWTIDPNAPVGGDR